jgi:hypothetical protein
MKMFGRKIIGVFVTMVVVLLMGCASTSIGPINGTYPKTPDGQCLIYSEFEIKNFDGMPSQWKSYENIIIPAGKHRIVHTRDARFIVEDRSYSYTTHGYDTVKTTYVTNYDYVPYSVIIDCTYEFKKGKKYKILGKQWGEYYIQYNTATKEITAKEGAEIFIDNKGNVTLVINVEVVEIKGSPYIRPEASGLVGLGMAYGGASIGQYGERFGLGILGGKMDLKLVGLGQFGPFIGSTLGFQYNYGGLLEYHFPNIGIGAGGGMFGILSYEFEEKIWKYDVQQPYLEFNISIRKDINAAHHVLYFHYYPSFGDEWYKTIGFGYKQNMLIK